MRYHAKSHSSGMMLGVGASRPVLVVLASLSVLVGLLVSSGGSASGAVTHKYLPEVSEAITAGVPAGSGALLPGPVSQVAAIAGDSGHVWLEETVEYASAEKRVDEFDASNGKYLGRQLNEEAGVGSLTYGVAVGAPFGEEEVYVGGGTNEKYVVAAYGSSGKLQAKWDGTKTQNKSFSEAPGKRVGTISGVAVDGSANLETKGDVYVATKNTGVFPGSQAYNVVDVFKPAAGGVEGKVVGELRGSCVAPGTCVGSEVSFIDPESVAVSGFNGDVLVVDGNPARCYEGIEECVVDVFEQVSGMPGVYSFLFKLTGTPGSVFKEPGNVAVGGNGNIYVADVGLHVVDEFTAAGVYVGRLTGVPSGGASSVTPFGSEAEEKVGVDPSSGNVFVSDYNREKSAGIVDVFGPDLVIPDVMTGSVTGVKVTSVGEIGMVLNGTVNIDKEGTASCVFVYGTSHAFGQSVSCSESVSQEGVVAVHGELSGLAPDTTYCYRLQASNKNGTNPGEAAQDQCFTTPGPGLHGESVTSISATSATLNATINPHSAPTTYYFQYGKSTEYEAQVPLGSGALLGSGEGDVEVTRHVQGLSASTVYHYRVVVISEPKAGEVETFVAPDLTFRTQGAGSAFSLLDGREWELVSPVDKHGAALLSVSESGIVQSAGSGDAVTYLGTLPTESGVQGYTEALQILSTRGSDGWSSQDISLPHATPVGFSIGGGQEYRFFSDDLASGLVEPRGEFTSLAPDVSPPDSERTLYVRHDSTCAATPTSCYEPLVTGSPGYADVPEGTKFGGGPGTDTGAIGFVGGTSDLAHVILSSEVALTSTYTGGGLLYEWSAGRTPSEELQLVSVLPEGKPASADLGSGPDARNAVSKDGSRIVWSAGSGGVSHLYLRDMVSEHTGQLDVVQPGGSGSGSAVAEFQAASSDGSRVLFTDRQRLTANSGTADTGQRDLYECVVVEVAGVPRCTLSDLTPLGSGGAYARVQGAVVGASEDASTVYFVADGVLAAGAVEGNCTEGNILSGSVCDLYVWHEGVTRLVAVLSGDDQSVWQSVLGAHPARASRDGSRLAFMSDRSLTGYDNHDANSGMPDEEVYLYDASANGGAGSVVCASCDPTGARPVGMEEGKLEEHRLADGFNVWPSKQWIAASVPGWTSYELNRARYQSRFLSDEGRLFFNSSDALVAQDINNTMDVYEYEPVGVGDCSTGSATFSDASGGCVGLVSSGTAAEGAVFLDASASGSDVFFLTGEKLVSQDVDGAVDVYDAHACTNDSPCVSAPVRSPECTTADACRVAPTPQPSVFGAPASATFSGAGNVIPSGPEVGVKAKALTGAQKLARALSVCHKKKGGARRVVCERQARRQYAVKRSSRAANATKSGRG